MTDTAAYSDESLTPMYRARSHGRLETGLEPELRDRALLAVVERHVLPRLVRRGPSVVRPERFGTSLSEAVRAMTGFALDGNAGRSRRILQGLHAEGAGFRDLQLALLAPAARRMNRMWRDDEVSFLDVTLAVGVLQQMMRFVALDLTALERRPYSGRTILISPVPGEDHVFGAAMAAEFFRHDGWTVNYEPRPSRESLVACARDGWFDALGLSLATHLDPVQACETVAAIRAGSMNRNLLVIAGGEGLVENPGLLSEIGADAGLAALEVAPARAHRLLGWLSGARI